MSAVQLVRQGAGRGEKLWNWLCCFSGCSWFSGFQLFFHRRRERFSDFGLQQTDLVEMCAATLSRRHKLRRCLSGNWPQQIILQALSVQFASCGEIHIFHFFPVDFSILFSYFRFCFMHEVLEELDTRKKRSHPTGILFRIRFSSRVDDSLKRAFKKVLFSSIDSRIRKAISWLASHIEVGYFSVLRAMGKEREFWIFV